MAEGIGQTLSSKAGPLPIWAWAGLGTAGLATVMIIRKKKSDAAAAAQNQQPLDSSNLGTVPISDLTQEASPMPIQMGDTFVDTTTSDNDFDPGGPIIRGPINRPHPPTKPPFAKPPRPSKKEPTKAPAPVPNGATKQKTITVCSSPQWCGSLWGIAQHEYGSGADWTRIYNANKAKIGSNPNLIKPGQVLVIPAKI